MNWDLLAQWGWVAAAGLVAVVWRSNEKKHEDRQKGEIALHQKIEANTKDINKKIDDHASEDRASFRTLEDKLDNFNNNVVNHLLTRIK